uniref:Ovule protein n=1 Tax=Meloidogyne incognita TaxID=6306 RepID=A0A914KIX3_MELIC
MLEWDVFYFLIFQNPYPSVCLHLQTNFADFLVTILASFLILQIFFRSSNCWFTSFFAYKSSFDSSFDFFNNFISSTYNWK